MTFSKESASAVVLKLIDLFSVNESKLALDGVGGFCIAAIRRLKFVVKIFSCFLIIHYFIFSATSPAKLAQGCGGRVVSKVCSRLSGPGFNSSCLHTFSKVNLCSQNWIIMILAKLLLQAPIRYGLVAWAKTQSFGIFLKFAHLDYLPSIVTGHLLRPWKSIPFMKASLNDKEAL